MQHAGQHRASVLVCCLSALRAPARSMFGVLGAVTTVPVVFDPTRDRFHVLERSDHLADSPEKQGIGKKAAQNPVQLPAIWQGSSYRRAVVVKC
jgi:hypothetical protein